VVSLDSEVFCIGFVGYRYPILCLFIPFIRGSVLFLLVIRLLLVPGIYLFFSLFCLHLLLFFLGTRDLCLFYLLSDSHITPRKMVDI